MVPPPFFCLGPICQTLTFVRAPHRPAPHSVYSMGGRAISANPPGLYVNIHADPYPAGAVRGQLER